MIFAAIRSGVNGGVVLRARKPRQGEDDGMSVRERCGSKARQNLCPGITTSDNICHMKSKGVAPDWAVLLIVVEKATPETVAFA